MKKFVFTIVFFTALLYAAPVNSTNTKVQRTQNTTGVATRKVATRKATNSKATRTTKATSATRARTTKAATTRTKATTKKASAQNSTKTKAQLRKEAQQRTFGLMPSELDDMAHNVFHAKAAAVKGARDTESALRYLPFVTIINTAGFGNQLDLRGQGRLSSTGIKFQINGIDATPVDSYYGFMPINTILPFLIQEVEVKPGVEARGGTINIITSKRAAPMFLVGAGYVNTTATQGNSFNAYTQVFENLGSYLKVNASLGVNQISGPRDDDSYQQGQAILGAEYDIGWGQRISFDIDAFLGKTKTSPAFSFFDSPFTPTLNTELNTASPDKDKRAKKGNGDIETSQIRAMGIIGWDNQITRKLNFNAKGFYLINNRKFDKYENYMPFVYIAAFPFYRNGENNFIDQSGTTFNEQKFGAKLALNYKHTGGLLTLGYNLTYEMNERTPKQYLRLLMNDNANIYTHVELDNYLKANKLTSEFFINEKYDFTQMFSLMGSFRYQLLNYNAKAKENVKGLILTNTQRPLSNAYNDPGLIWNGKEYSYNENFDNFIFELAPIFSYATNGFIYARGETGYITPPAYALFQKQLVSNFAPQNPGVNLGGASFELELYNGKINDFNNEIYFTAELGFKHTLGERYIPLYFADFDFNALLFSANVFYTQSKDEFYFTGDPYSKMGFGTYDKSRRMGVEVAFEQYIFNGILGFNESFTYLKAEKFGFADEINQSGEKKWDIIPYTYDFKATFGVNANISHHLEIINVSLGVWLQNSLYGNQRVPSSSIRLTTGSNVVETPRKETLKPYVISDFGVSVGINKEAAVFTVGIKNIFDTFYYDYYNHQGGAAVNENRYVIGRGRTVFVEGQYKY